MSEQAGQQALQPEVPVAAALAYVCRYLDEICEVLRPDGDGPGGGKPMAVRKVTDAVLVGGDLRRPLDELHAALLDADDPKGIWGTVRALIPVGLDAGVPFEPLYACPHDRCSGHSIATAAAVSFTCTLTRKPLRNEIL